MTEGPVQLIVPAVGRYGRLARLMVAGLAAEAGFDVDEVEDVRVAVNELFALVVEDGEDPGSTVAINLRLGDDEIVVDGVRRYPDGTPPTPDLDDLALGLLSVIVDAHAVEVDGDGRHFRFVKRRQPAPT